KILLLPKNFYAIREGLFFFYKDQASEFLKISELLHSVYKSSSSYEYILIVKSSSNASVSHIYWREYSSPTFVPFVPCSARSSSINLTYKISGSRVTIIYVSTSLFLCNAIFSR